VNIGRFFWQNINENLSETLHLYIITLGEKLMSIYIGNLSFDVTEKDLEEVFADYGTVKKISLPRDRETGKMRGFGFVEMENDSEEEKAIADLDEAEWMGRTLKVNKARPREKRSSFSGGNNRKNDYFKRGF